MVGACTAYAVSSRWAVRYYQVHRWLITAHAPSPIPCTGPAPVDQWRRVAPRPLVVQWVCGVFGFVRRCGKVQPDHLSLTNCQQLCAKQWRITANRRRWTASGSGSPERKRARKQKKSGPLSKIPDLRLVRNGAVAALLDPHRLQRQGLALLLH